MAKGRIEKGDIVAEGILKDFNKDLKTATDNVNLLTTALKAVQETGKALKKGVSTVKPKDVKTIKEFNALTSQSNANAKNRLQVDKSLLTAKEKLKQAQSAQNKAIKVEVALGDKQINTLEKLRARNQAIKIAKDKVNFSTKKGQDAIRKLNAELDKNNAVLQKNASALGKQKMNIGNYKSAISGLRSGLAQLGLSMGVFQILKGSFNIVKDFEQGQADLASVLGINVDEMAALTAQAKELGATTTFTATQVSELQKEYAKLGFSMSEIEAVTEATLSLAEATGTDLGRAAEVTGATIRGFGLSADETQRVVDVMAKSFSSSSLDMEKFATAMSAVAPVAKNAGFSIEQTTALIGTLTDRGIDASSAGTGLRNMFLDAKKNGLSFNEALEQVNGATDKTAESFKLFGKRGATLGVILAENGSSVDELTGKLKDSDGAAKKMADTQRNTLGGAIALLTSAWEGWILKMNEAGGAGDRLGRGIRFLADNLDTILSVMAKVGAVMLIYKTRLIAINIAQKIFNTESGKMNVSLKTAVKNMKAGAKAGTGLGGALKSIGWAAVIAGAVALAKAFYDVISGARALRIEASKMADTLANAESGANTFLDKVNANQERAIKLLNDRRKLGQITDEQFLKGKAQIIKDSEIEIAQGIRAVKNRRDATKDKLKGIQSEMDAIKDYKQLLEQAQIGEASGLGMFATDAEANAIRLFREQAQLQANLDAQLFKIDAYSKGIERNNELVTDATIDIKLNTKEVNENNDAKERQINLELEERALALKALETSSPEREDIEFADTNQEQLQRNVLEAEYNILIADVNQTEEERINLLTRQIIARAELEKYGKTEAEQQVINARMLKSINALSEKQIEAVENNSQLLNDAIKITTDYFIEQADRRIAKIDEEIDAATKQADHYRSLAENGNITAKESLAEQNRLIAEANIKKEQEEKRKQRIEMVSAVLSAFNANLQVEGTTSAEAFTKAITSTTLLTQFIGALPTFLEGTEDTGAQGRGVDGKGGFNAILHPNERVMTKEQNAMIGGVSNDYVAQVMEQHRVGNYMDGGLLIAKIDNAELISGLSNLENKMSAVEKAILNQPRESNNTAEMLSNYMMFENKQTQGGKTTTSRFKVRK